jgi:hypothetical protein
MSGPFATATELCEWIGLAVPSDLARLQSILLSASSVIRRYCDQTLSVVANDQVTLPPVSGSTLILPERPVTAVASVVVNGTAVTDFWFTTAGILHRGSVTGTIGADWVYGATVTYTHGYAEMTDGFGAIKTICMEAAARAYTLNERSASEAMGSTLMESAGYSPEVFLTEGEKRQLADLGKVGIG